jgi:hypothetical protein
MCVALSEYFSSRQNPDSTLPYQMNERRGCVCYAQAKFYIDRVLRHETKTSKMIFSSAYLLPNAPHNNIIAGFVFTVLGSL